ncbi:hypothetical protein M9979_02975 [Sphingomonas sp. RP10(2022)]|uniref:ATP-binding protein n=1 Tax=Sphingomonas liriopis TaxID=2949094 RepID=A0A9X2KPF0_9SPHN|nr:hypothetical protein [Sphingomonas liriopis]MCP3733840.1 hypothetical protein [Sphingomonas liriopis]
MTALVDTVSVRRRFQRSVRIDGDIGAEATSGFVCTSTAAQALRTTIEHVSRLGHGAFTWTGPYGCGKSSLAVVLATALGPDGPGRQGAMAVLPHDVAARFADDLRWAGDGWSVVPVTGRRADAEEVIGDALDEHRIPQRKGGVIPRLVAAAGHGIGLVLIVDEMGKLLEHAAAGHSDAFFFQELAEAASRSEGRLIVIGILHQAFDDYAYRLARETRDDWLKVQGRYVDVPLNPVGEEQLALLATAIDAPGAPEVQPAAAAVAAAIRVGSGVVGGIEATLRGCWPLSPVVACLLGPLSRRRFGQNQRSLFGFLGSAEPYGFQDYLASTQVDDARPYDVGLLWNYLRANLEPSILASPDGHRWSLAVDAVERCEARGGTEHQLRLVKAIALVDMFRERSGLVAGVDILGAALPDVPEADLRQDLETLKAWSVIVYRRHLDAFSLYAGSDFDIEHAVSGLLSATMACDYGRLRSTGVFGPILAKRHYHDTGAMRWFEVDVASLDAAEERIARFRGDSGAVGLFLLLINEAGASAGTVRRRVALLRERIGGRAIAIGVATDSFMLRELSLELIALESIQSTRPELKGDPVARREVASRIARVGGELEERLRASLAVTSWHIPDEGERADADGSEGPARLSLLASRLAGAMFPASPRIRNELMNRSKPSSNAMAAARALMVAMVRSADRPRLGIEDFPAEGGLYASILERSGLHGPVSDGGHGFRTPPNDADGARLLPLWDGADALLAEAGSAGMQLSDLFDRWRARPFGVKDGLLPILGLAFILSRGEEVSVYLDGAFISRIGDLFVDRLLQDAGSVRLRRNDISEDHVRILQGIAETTAELLGEEMPPQVDPLSVGRQLVAVVTGAQGWVRRTARMGPAATRVRDLAASAHDPNKFMLDDLPTIFADGDATAQEVIGQIRDGLVEISTAYDHMVADLADRMLAELAVGDGDDALDRLRKRAATVVGLTGNYRLDAFATRLASFHGGNEAIEGLASLAANKPPRDWVDRDVDAATIELAALSQEFLRAEGLAHVKGRDSSRIRMAFYMSDPGRPALVAPEFSVDDLDRQRARSLATKLRGAIDSRTSREVALAAIIELGAQLADELTPSSLPASSGPKRKAG